MTLEDELATAAATGNTADVEDLLQAGASVNGANRFGRTALQVGVRRAPPTDDRTRVFVLQCVSVPFFFFFK